MHQVHCRFCPSGAGFLAKERTMRIPLPMAFTVLSLLAMGSARGEAQETPPPEGAQQVAGSSVYKTYCEVCHGHFGQGDGPLADSLRSRPSDLTALARKNGGVFPREQVERTVDGRKPVKGHGGADMPVWGDAFKNVRERYDEAAIKAKIKAVVDHLETLQVK
jgi:mono/diheme cytochrome c family protein